MLLKLAIETTLISFSGESIKDPCPPVNHCGGATLYLDVKALIASLYTNVSE